MLRRTVVIGTVLAVLVAMGPFAAYAQTPAGKPADTTKPVAKPAEAAKPQMKPAEGMKMGEQAKAPVGGAAHAANTLAVCACGMAFVPDAKTKYVEYGGKKYACCSEECHKMAMADPAKAAKMADDNMAKAMTRLNPAKP